MAWLYGNPISENDYRELLRRLRLRGTRESVNAMHTIMRKADRAATPETTAETQQAILHELEAWPELDDSNPKLAALRNRLSHPIRAERVI